MHFLNRGGATNVTNPASLAPMFSSRPAGGTPMLTTLRRVFEVYSPVAASGRRVIVIFFTDGEPSDGSVDDLFRLLNNNRHANIHISIAGPRLLRERVFRGCAYYSFVSGVFSCPCQHCFSLRDVCGR